MPRRTATGRSGGRRHPARAGGEDVDVVEAIAQYGDRNGQGDRRHREDHGDLQRLRRPARLHRAERDRDERGRVREPLQLLPLDTAGGRSQEAIARTRSSQPRRPTRACCSGIPRLRRGVRAREPDERESEHGQSQIRGRQRPREDPGHQRRDVIPPALRDPRPSPRRQLVSRGELGPHRSAASRRCVPETLRLSESDLWLG